MVRVSINLRNIEPSEYRPITHLPSRCWMRQRARKYVSSAWKLRLITHVRQTLQVCRPRLVARTRSLVSRH